MKKIYLTPETEVIIQHSVYLLTDSLPTDPESTSGEEGWGGPQSTDAEFEKE